MRSAPGASAGGGAKVVPGADGTRAKHVAGEAQAALSAVVRTPEDGGVREPVWGQARTGDTDGEGCADDKRSEADGARDAGRERRDRAAGSTESVTGNGD